MGDWSFFLRDTGGGETYLHWMMTAWGWTLAVAALALVVALVVGSVMGILRTTPSKALVFLGNAWTELFRNIPLLVQIFLWYHVIPSIFTSLRAVPSYLLVVFAIGFFTSARISEQVRAGIQSLSRGQRYAGLAVGLTLPQTYRYVLLPMAYRIIIPPLTRTRCGRGTRASAPSTGWSRGCGSRPTGSRSATARRAPGRRAAAAAGKGGRRAARSGARP